MPVQPAPGLGRAPRSRWTAPRGLRSPKQASQRPNPPWARLVGCFAALVLAACTPTRIMLTAEPEAMATIDNIYVVAGTEAALEEALGADKDSGDFFNFTETLRLNGTREAGALAFVDIRKLSGEDLSEAQEEARKLGGKPLASNRWRISTPSTSDWMSTKFDLLGDAVSVALTKSGFKYHPEMNIAIIVGTTEDGDSWRHYRTRIPTVDLTPGGFLFITRGKRLTFDLKADNDPERVLDAPKLDGQDQ